MGSETPDLSRLRTAPNLRDLGGHPAAGGVVRRGQVFRSAGLGPVTGADLAAVAGLGLRVVYDLRTTAERTAHPDVLPDGVDGVHLDVLAGAARSAAASMTEMDADPVAVTAALSDGHAVGLLAEAYRDIVRLDSAREAYRSLFEGLADGHRRPALFHCTTGKDRTGWAAAVLLLLLGVDEETVREDYLRTNDDLIAALRPLLDDFAARGGDPEVLLPILGVRTEYLDTAFHELRASYADVQDYVVSGLGVSEQAVAELRAGLVETGPIVRSG